MSSVKATISEIITKNKKRDNPILLRFQNGQLTEPASKEYSYFNAIDADNNNKKLAVVTTNRNVYRGYVNDDESSQLVNKFIAIRNKETNKIRFVEIDEASLINDVYHQKDAKIANQLATESARNLLIKNFGGRKANISLERNERMKVSIDVVKTQLDKTLEETTVNNEDESLPMNVENINKIRPPFNKDAKKLDDVYKLNDVIPQELFDRLKDEAEALISTELNEIPIASEYLQKKIKEIHESFDPLSEQNITALKVFIYMDALLALIKLRSKKLQRVTLSNITEKVENDIRRRFSDPSTPSFTKTSYTRDKAICYFITLALLTSSNYEINLNVLMQELAKNRQEIIKYAMIVNAKPIPKTERLTLRLPGKMKLNSMFMRKRT